MSGFVFIALLLVVMTTVSIRQANILADQTEQMYQYPLTVNNNVLKIHVGINAIQNRMSDIALTHYTADLNRLVAEVDSIERSLSPSLDLISEQFLGNSSTISETRKALSEWKNIRSVVIELSRANKDPQMIALAKANNDEYVKSLSRHINNIGDFASRKSAEFLMESKSVHRQRVIHILAYMTALLVAAGAVGYYVVNTVVTSERNLIDKIKDIDRHERLFRGMFHAISDGIILTDTDRNIIMANKGMKTTFGYEEHELIGQTTSILYESIEEFERQGKIRFNLSADEMSKPYLVRNRHKDGHVFLGEVIGTAIKDKDGKVISFLGVIRDISERLEMEETLRHAQKMESLGNLAGGIAHEVNNMLLPIISLTEMTLRDVPEESRAHKHLEKVIQAGTTAKHLISGLLTFSHRSDLQVTKEEVDIVSVIEDALKHLRPSVPSHITITNDLDPNTGRVFCDTTQISNVFNYLTKNSIDSIEDHVGKIHIASSPVILTPPSAQKTGNLPPGKYAIISFSDTGCGMDADKVSKVFDPFFTTKDVGKGTGLGLSMAYGIIEQHGGAIIVSSEVGVGTTFDIYLPLINQQGS